LNAAECGEVLAASRVGHLACALNAQPYVVPMYFAYADDHLYGFSMPGKKIDVMRANPLVSVAFEQRGTGRAWKSVVVDGRFEELADRIGSKRAREHAWTVLSTHAEWWVPGSLKPATTPLPSPRGHVFFRIRIDAMSGREAVDAQ